MEKNLGSLKKDTKSIGQTIRILNNTWDKKIAFLVFIFLEIISGVKCPHPIIFVTFLSHLKYTIFSAKLNGIY